MAVTHEIPPEPETPNIGSANLRSTRTTAQWWMLTCVAGSTILTVVK